jgi:hypothetical protein
VGPTRQSHGPNRGTHAAALPAPTALLPPFWPTVSTTTPPSSTASCGFKRSALPKELLLSSSSVHASPLLSSLFASATAAADADALECPSNTAEQEHRPQTGFYLELAAVKSPRSHPTPCAVSTESASSTAAISGHRPPSVSPP